MIRYLSPLLLFPSLISFSMFAHSDDVYGQFDCRVTSVNLMAVKDGKSEIYKGWSDGWEVGDYFRFSYQNVDKSYVGFDVFYPKKDGDVSVLGTAITKGDWSTNYVSDRYVKYSDKYNDISVSKNEIRLKNILLPLLTLRKYGDNKWEGLIVGTNEEIGTHPYSYISTSTTAIDCRHSVNRFDQLFKFIGEMNNE